MFGLKESDVDYIINQAKKVSEVEKLAIFGSRANGQNRDNSDIDIVVYGKNITKNVIFLLHEMLEENAPYPFFVDIVHYEKADSLVVEEIDKNKCIIYEINSIK